MRDCGICLVPSESAFPEGVVGGGASVSSVSGVQACERLESGEGAPVCAPLPRLRRTCGGEGEGICLGSCLCCQRGAACDVLLGYVLGSKACSGTRSGFWRGGVLGA